MAYEVTVITKNDSNEIGDAVVNWMIFIQEEINGQFLLHSSSVIQ